jgi:DNA-binding MarR family transcriptional regulator/N-acetylglutamate synthase-like GNAT family acetyltransferase
MRTAEIEGIREFNRFYTRQLGLLDQGLLDSPFSLTEVRVLYELAHRRSCTASEIAAALGLDAGYLSRILRRLDSQGLLERRRSDRDLRRTQLVLNRKGRAVFAPLDRGAHDQVASLLEPLRQSDRQRLLAAVSTIRALLRHRAPEKAAVTLRTPRPGDIGWAIERHGALYAEEYGWDATFEGLVAKIFGAFLERHDPARERCWIAEVDGQRAGCVFVVRNARRRDTAQLRCLLVEPWARGLGVGRRLVAQCIDFAREAGYARMLLWTNDVLASARRIYEAAGFELTAEERHRSFGHDLVGQTWVLSLR